ncbi:MAG: bifunctional adenosylcobinamide kinase/adenosylcobinamide-phosphate guanylyltransferase, partial [Microlunatus sp.]|nr:bifunctional adenosylcobinamide kinase/adenosylcobinamide-phosphate guanylyltransferase [Microlunatus sp.]
PPGGSPRARELVHAWEEADVIGVTNEVGWGVVPEHASGRLFADLLGRLNQQIAAASDEVVLMVMGRPVQL